MAVATETPILYRHPAGDTFPSPKGGKARDKPFRRRCRRFPWYEDDGKTIRGVFGITFYEESMNNLLSIEAFGGKGRSFALNESGLVVLDSGYTPANKGRLDQQFTDVLREDEENSTEEIDAIESQLEGDGDSQGTVYIDGDEKLYYQKILSFKCLNGDVQWRIFTTVSQSYVRGRFFAVNFDFYTLVGVFILIFIVSVAGVLFLARKYRNTVERVAYIDQVTGGENYPGYIRQLRRMKAKSGTFVCLDIIGFNTVRIAVGPSEGGNILRLVNKKIKKLLTADEIIAHVDRDTFALFLSVTDHDVLQKRLEEFSASLLELSKELGIPHLRIRCGSYISENIKPDDVDDYYNRANQANEMARRNRHSYWLYDESDNEQMMFEHKLAGYFHEAIKKEEFEVWYQPKYSAATKKIVGSEALVRWRRNEKLISPGKFIPLFENNGMITRLDEYMFRHVCRFQKQLKDKGKRIVPVSVNLSRATMYNDNVNIVDKYMGILNEHDVDVKHVQIEITESAVTDKYDVTVLLRKFRDMGEHILLDDFGTGYSSISMLCSKCFDTLKIDKSLIDNIESKDGKTLVSSIIQMAHKLDMSVTAEGIESQAQYEQLRLLNCNDIQGFYFSHPLPADEYEKLLDNE